MTHRSAPRRIAALAVLTLTALAACGGGEPAASGDSVAAPATTPASAPGTAAGSEPGLRAPTPIEYTSGTPGGAQAAAESAGAAPVAADGRMATDMMIAPTYVAEFVVADGLPALPTDSTGYVYDAATPTTAEQAAELAALLGVAGEPVRVDDWTPGGWQVGPTDGSAPSLFLSDDGQHTWSFSPAWPDGGGAVGSVGCAVPPSSDPGGTTYDSCVQPSTTVPTPPAGILTADEAAARAMELLGQLAVDTAGLSVEPYADEWSASVTVNDPVTGRYWGFGFGAEGALQWANGTLATPEPVGPYELVDLDTAVARLNEQQAGMPMPIDVLATDATGAIEAPIAPVPATVVGDAEILPVPGTFPAPEPVTVTLVDVQADFWWAWDADGSVWLVPAYRFIGDDGGWYTVPAVTDDYLVQVDPPVPTESPVVDPPITLAPDAAPTDPPATVPPGTDPTSGLEGFVGLSIDEFTAQAEVAGWTVRVSEIDGAPQPGTMDYRTDRVNVAVVTGADGTQTVKQIISIG